uniref:ZP domain-containing protein n=1 Tax=Ditylenchus dipsaci TaxID=166011 RepID=A0A915DWU5_9BILA
MDTQPAQDHLCLVVVLVVCLLAQVRLPVDTFRFHWCRFTTIYFCFHRISEPIPTQPLKFEEAFSEQGILSATFTIAKRRPYPAAVTVTEVKLDDPVLHYDCVPSRNSKDVFLTATGINSTNYPLLEGPASIFTDNCFSSKMKLKTVNSGEKFSVPLGTDPSVQLRYGVCSYRKEGLFNHRSPSLRIKRLRSHLICPFGKSSEENSLSPALDEDNILKWTEELKPGEEKELLVKWSMEYPVDETIDHNQQEIRHSK